MIRDEYLRFLMTLDESTPEGVRKIANLVLEHMEDLIPLSTSHGNRIRKIVELAQSNWSTVSSAVISTDASTTEQQCAISHLKSMKAGPFRGFSKQEEFELGKSLVLIYGPNGSGKSSFCEALEFGLLGHVTEADSKRLNQSDYLKNANTGSFENPEIWGFNVNGENVQVSSDEAGFRFCFVEKNRIDNFSRIAALAPSRQTELIATLFGLDDFNDFVKNFSTSMDNRYIDLKGVQAQSLAEKRQSLTGHRQQLEDNKSELSNIEKSESDLARQYREGLSFSQVNIELNGNYEKQGTLQTLEKEVRTQFRPKSSVTRSELDQLKDSINKELDSLQSNKEVLASESENISYKNLYEAVNQLQDKNPDVCPACKTAINRTALDPYKNASDELKNLKHLSEIQELVLTLEQSIFSNIDRVASIVNTCRKQFSSENILENCQITSTTIDKIEWWKSLFEPLEDQTKYWGHIKKQVEELEKEDLLIDQAIKERDTKSTLLDSYKDVSRKILVLQTKRETAEKAIGDAQKALDDFETTNAELIKDAEAEKAVVATNNEIADSYEKFVRAITSHSDALPSQLVADLGELVVELYNAINRNDDPSELLKTLNLPLKQSERLTISFRTNPDKKFDALHVLSEGHIRCIGLSILLAKNIQENCPILIFDDPVNAIDDDHRESIRKTLFEGNLFESKQILITCHGEEFFKDIQNMLHREQARKIKSFTFLPRLGDTHIRVDFNSPSRNYIILAREYCDKIQVRDSLAKCRQALESLTKRKIWNYVNKFSDGKISLTLSNPKAPIELRELTEKLRSKISSDKFSVTDKQKILSPLNKILGIDGGSAEWRYLNKGTHEEQDRTEFDRHTVSEIVTALEELDSAFTS